jgi:hypothetical protein
MCLPQGLSEESSTQSVFAHHKRDVCKGALEGRLGGCSAIGPQRPLYLAGAGEKRERGQLRVWGVEPLGHLSWVLQTPPKHSCLLLQKEVGSLPAGGLD